MTKRRTPNAKGKDFLRSVGKSKGRFLSIFFMALLGVAFFAGVRATEPDMRASVDEYMDSAGYMDIRVLSTLGLTDADLEAIKRVGGITQVAAGYEADVLCQVGRDELTVKCMSDIKGMNALQLLEGELPQAVGECFADSRLAKMYGLKLGDELRVFSGDDKDIADSLCETVFTVTGIGSWPGYMTFQRGSTTIGSGSLDAFLVLPEETFAAEAYSVFYIRTAGLDRMATYDDDYKEALEEVTDPLEDMKEERLAARHEDLMSEILEGEEELSDHQQEYDDALTELEEGKQEYLDNKTQVEKELSDALKKLEKGESSLEEGWKTYNKNKKKLDKSKKEIKEGEAQLAQGKKTLDENRTTYNTSRAAADEAKKTLDDSKAALDANKTALDQAGEQIAQLKAGMETAKAGMDQLETALAGIDAQINALDPNDGAYQATLDGLNQQKAALQTQYSTAKGTYDSLKNTYDTQSPAYDAGLAQWEAGKAAYDEGLAQWEAGDKQLKEAKDKLDSAQKDYDSNAARIAQGKKELISGEKALKSGYNKLKANEKKLKSARADYKEGKAEAEEKLADAAREIADGETELADAAEELADARQELFDARQQVEDLGEGKWYVLTREANVAYAEYSEDAARIGRIGKVFPLIFFLVAALVSLTTMTRMVEEERGQIGLYAALGYSRGRIVAKYAGYSVLATTLGSLAGVMMGEKVIPYVIQTAYGILYENLPVVNVEYRWGPALLATLAMVLCNLAATLWACGNTLGQTPAQLMRPVSPKAGRKILIERIPLIWQRLKFSRKATLRNLFRYKKRLFMTIFGIGGCMALLLVGFGLGDSIHAIINNQFEDVMVYDLQADFEEDEDTNLLLAGEAGDTLFARTLTVDALMPQDRDSRLKKVELVSVVVPQTEAATDYTSFFVLRDRVSAAPISLTDEGAVISEKLATLLGVAPGDSFTIEREDETWQIRVAALTENYLNHFIYLSPGAYREMFGEEPRVNSAYYRLADASEENVRAFSETLLKNEQVKATQVTAELVETVSFMMDALNMVVWVLIVAAGLLAFVVIFNLNNINITERRRELATLKVLGFYDGEVAAYVYRENVILTIFGILVGMIFGKYLHLFVIMSAETDIIMFGRHILPLSWALSILLTVVFAAFVNGVMYFMLKRIDMIDSLKSVE